LCFSISGRLASGGCGVTAQSIAPNSLKVESR
jgi:hypothetical protein